MSVLTEQLQKASFRGVPFEVTSASLTAGRRTVVHEYPQRDKPYVEDLGRASRKLRSKLSSSAVTTSRGHSAFWPRSKNRGPGRWCIRGWGKCE